MGELMLGATLLSIVHAAIPNHWLPLVALSKSEGWDIRRTRMAALLAGGAHVMSTILIGMIVGGVGMVIFNMFEKAGKYLAPVILIGLGVYNIIEYLKCKGIEHHHTHEKCEKNDNKRFYQILLPVTIGMFFSPCVELEAYYLRAAVQGWAGIITVSIIYLTVTIGLILLLVEFGVKGVEALEWRFLEHHEQAVTGITLIILGISSIWIF